MKLKPYTYTKIHVVSLESVSLYADAQEERIQGLGVVSQPGSFVEPAMLGVDSHPSEKIDSFLDVKCEILVENLLHQAEPE